jgi:hypothetical protein
MKPWTKAAVQGAACGLVLGMVVLTGGRLWQPQVAAAQAKQAAVPDVVRARSFEVVDAAGKPRAGLDVLSDGRSGLQLHDAAENPRAALVLTQDGSTSLRLADKAGTERAVLGVSSLKTVETREVRVRPESSLVLFGKDRNVMWNVP